MSSRSLRELNRVLQDHSGGGRFARQPLGPRHLTALFKQAAWLGSSSGSTPAAYAGGLDPAATQAAGQERRHSDEATAAPDPGSAGTSASVAAARATADPAPHAHRTSPSAHLGQELVALLDELSERLFQQLDRMDTRGVCEVAWAMGKLRWVGGEEGCRELENSGIG